MEINNNKPIYSISSVARLLEISVHTIRMYEREGLIIPHKENNRNRLFSDSDIERMRYIRKLIHDKKYSIAAIQALFSFIPCWNILNCSEQDRNSCQSYEQSEKPCWMFKHKSNICAKQECRDCEVYINFEGNDIKQFIRNLA